MSPAWRSTQQLSVVDAIVDGKTRRLIGQYFNARRLIKRPDWSFLRHHPIHSHARSVVWLQRLMIFFGRAIYLVFHLSLQPDDRRLPSSPAPTNRTFDSDLAAATMHVAVPTLLSNKYRGGTHCFSILPPTGFLNISQISLIRSGHWIPWVLDPFDQLRSCNDR